MRRPVHALALSMALGLLAGCAGGAEQAAAPEDETAGVEAAASPEEDAPKDDAELGLPPGATAAPVEDAEDGAAPDPPDDKGSAEPAPDDSPAEPEEEAFTVPEGLPGGRYVRIDGIELDGDSYAATFEAYGFTPLIGTGAEDHHIHFFFDSVAPENAGTNGPDPGEWFLYDGPSPFTGYTGVDRPADASALCALVADAGHGVTVGSGNCLPLP